MSIVLGYWKTRALAQSIRLVLAYAGEEFEDKRYEPTWDDENKLWDKKEWLDVKFKLGLPFPNLPYLIDGDVKVTESNAILCYLGRKYDLMGKDENERIYNDMLLQLSYELHSKFFDVTYWNYFTKKDEYIKSLPNLLRPFSEFLADKPWFAGVNLTVCDFHMYEVLDQHRVLEPKCLEPFENLQKFCNRFEALPTITAYMKSEKFLRVPLNNKYAQFTGV